MQLFAVVPGGKPQPRRAMIVPFLEESHNLLQRLALRSIAGARRGSAGASSMTVSLA